MQRILSFMLGYLISAGLGHIVTSRVMRKLSKDCKIDRGNYEPLPGKLGILERILYTSVLVAGFKELIAFWLLAKVGAGWIWQIRGAVKGDPGANYNVFLIGNVLSILFGGLGALIIWILNGGKAAFLLLG